MKKLSIFSISIFSLFLLNSCPPWSLKTESESTNPTKVADTVETSEESVLAEMIVI